MFKTTQAQDIKVGDVERIVSEDKGTIYYYYYRATSVYTGVKVDAIHDPFTNAFVANRSVTCVEIDWLPLSYAGKSRKSRYQLSVTLDVATNVGDVKDLIQEEDATND
jgi:hypothetical protein